MGIFIGMLFFLWILFVLVVGIGGTIFWIIMLIHAATKDIKDKMVWVLILVFTHLIGAIIYYFVVKKPFDAALKARSVPPVDQNPKTPPVPPTPSVPPASNLV